MGNADILNFESDVVDCPNTTNPTRIAVIRPGESITLKSLATAGQNHFVGSQITAKAKKGFKLASGESMTISLPRMQNKNVEAEIWALPETAGDDVTYFKAFDVMPETRAGGS